LTRGNEETCFVIMPIKDELDPVLFAIREAVDQANEGLGCVRLDDLRHAGRITDDLARAIESAKICIADLSGMNPNVMWEIGFAMSREKPIILLAQETKDLPFDIRHYRVICYDLRTARKSLPPLITLALKETSKLYQWHASSPVINSEDHARERKSWLSVITLRISLSISLLALLVVSGFLWHTAKTLNQSEKMIRASSTVLDGQRKSIAELRAENGNLQQENGNLQQKIVRLQKLRPVVPPPLPTKNAVNASYAIKGHQDLEYGKHARVNFSYRISNAHADVETGTGWRFNVKQTGLYKIEAFIETKNETNLHFILRSSLAGTLLPDQNGTEASASRADLSGDVRLDAGDEVWFEAWHSRVNTAVTAGRCIIQLVQQQ